MELIVETRGVPVCKHQGRLRVMRDKEKLQEVPLIMLEQVLIASNGGAITSDVVLACSENGIPIHFVGSSGRPYGTLYSSGLTGTIQTRRAQLKAYTDERGAVLAKAFVRGKLENQVNLLRAMVKNRREHDPQCFEEVHIIVAEVRDALLSAEAISGKTCDDIRQRLLAAEGRGAERYWTGVRRLLLADLDWPGRQTQGATDPLNAALNYGYGILFDMFERKERERLIEMAGAVETLEDKTTWADVSSYSRRQGNATSIGDLIGAITFAGNLKPLLPLLAWGMVLQVGKDTTKDNGVYLML